MSSPEDSILTSLQEIVEAYVEDDFKVVVEKCQRLLKRRKQSLDDSIVSALQRLLLQSYIQQEAYARVKDYISNEIVTGSTNKNQFHPHRDLELYALYRQEDYKAVIEHGSVSKKSQDQQQQDPSLRHLLAQSYFHLNQTASALQLYQDMLQDIEKNSSTPLDNDNEGKMEILTNAIAALTSVAIPYVDVSALDGEEYGGSGSGSGSSSNTNKNVTLFGQQAETFLEDHPDCIDLAFNVGTLRTLTGDYDNAWLAKAAMDCEDPEDEIPIDINMNWRQQFWQSSNAGATATTMGTVNYDTTEGTVAQKAVAQLNQALVDHRPLATKPHPKWMALQVKMYWYNRAVYQYQSRKYVECQESCQSLKKAVGNQMTKSGSKDSTSSAELWWHSRMDVILAFVQKDQNKIDSAITKLEDRLKALKLQPSSSVIDHATAYVQLHLHSLRYGSSSSAENKKSLLKSLPESIQNQPAIGATLEALERAIESKASKATISPTAQAETLFSQGKYAEASKIYEEHLPSPSECNSDQLSLHLKQIQALALSERHEEVENLWKILEPFLDDETDWEVNGTVNGEMLENKALPRSATSKTASSFSTPVSEESETKSKRSREKVLKQRTKKREAYLKALEEKGLYNPNRPTKPNEERWLPKHERSRARRRGQNTRSAQGGGSQVDAQRLDAAARRAGIISSSAGPSTANMKVSTSGKKAGRRR